MESVYTLLIKIEVSKIMPLFPEGHKQNGWTDFLSFLWDGGARSLIVVILVLGASGITVLNKDLCPGLASVASGEKGIEGKGGTPLVQPNPICSKYFELVSLVIGGYSDFSR